MQGFRPDLARVRFRDKIMSQRFGDCQQFMSHRGKPVDFIQATDRLLDRGVSLADIAEGMGLSYATVRAFRLDPESESHRRPPDDWRPKLAKLARGRGEELVELAEELEG